MHRKRIGKEMVRREPDLENILPAHRTKIANAATERGNKAVDNEFLACQFILEAENSQYKDLKTALVNGFVFGNNDYPKDMMQALALLKNYKNEGGKTSSNSSNNNKDKSPGVIFVQPGNGGYRGGYRDSSKDQCFFLRQTWASCVGIQYSNA